MDGATEKGNLLKVLGKLGKLKNLISFILYNIITKQHQLIFMRLLLFTAACHSWRAVYCW